MHRRTRFPEGGVALAGADAHEVAGETWPGSSVANEPEVMAGVGTVAEVSFKKLIKIKTNKNKNQLL